MKITKLLFLAFYVFESDFYAQNFINQGFEEGPSSGWTVYSQGGYGLIGTSEFFYSNEITPSVFPHSGQYMCRLGGFSYEINSIKQTVTLPNSEKVYLGINYQTRASTTSECSGLWVGARIRVYVGGQVLYEEYLCNYNAVNEWTFGYFDLSPIAGQQVEIGFRADAANSVWSYLYLDDISILTSLTDNEINKIVPEKFNLEQNYPNPFNPTTIIKYSLPPNDKIETSNVLLTVYDILGKEVVTLVNEKQSEGNYEVKFDGSKLPSGIYFYQLKSGMYSEVKKMELIK